MPQNQKSRESSVEDQIKEAQAIVDNAQYIIDGLIGNGAWERVLEDFQKERQRLDDTWQFVQEDKRWYEYRITKMAVLKIVNLIGDYRQDKETALSRIQDLIDTEDRIPKDVDN